MDTLSVYFRDESWNRVQALHLKWPLSDEFDILGIIGITAQSNKAVFTPTSQYGHELVTPCVHVITLEGWLGLGSEEDAAAVVLYYPHPVILPPDDAKPLYGLDGEICTRIHLPPNHYMSITYSRNPKIIPIPVPYQDPTVQADPSLDGICSP